MNYPSPLCIGDTVGLIAPSSPINPENLLPCIHMITSLGYQVELGKSCTESLHGYLAGTDEIRANDINNMFSDPKIKAIFSLRGGYGSTRILQLLDYPMIRKHPKLFVGYSDITSFHLAFYTLCHLVTFHGPMVSSNMIEDFDEYTKDSFLKAISMPNTFHFHNPVNQPINYLIEGKTCGRIVGGCLSLVSPSIGTFYQPDFCGKILFLEDVEESLPRCDKLMQHLIHSGILDQVNGILLGNFLGCDNPKDPSYTIRDYLDDLFQGYKKPVVYGLQSGHDKPMGTIPLGTMCELNTYMDKISFHYI